MSALVGGDCLQFKRNYRRRGPKRTPISGMGRFLCLGKGEVGDIMGKREKVIIVPRKIGNFVQRAYEELLIFIYHERGKETREENKHVASEKKLEILGGKGGREDIKSPIEVYSKKGGRGTPWTLEVV